MKKNSIYLIGIYLAFPIIFNVLFFLYVGTDNTISVWLSYVFIHIAYILLILTRLFVPNAKKFHEVGLELQTVSLIYFIIELIIGVYHISKRDNFVTSVLVVQLIILVIYIFVLSINLMVKDHAVISGIKHATSNATIENMLLQISDCKSVYKDNNDVKKVLNYLYDLVNSSSRKYTEETIIVDGKIERILNDLLNTKFGTDSEELVSTVASLENLINSRNRIINSSK